MAVKRREDVRQVVLIRKATLHAEAQGHHPWRQHQHEARHRKDLTGQEEVEPGEHSP